MHSESKPIPEDAVTRSRAQLIVAGVLTAIFVFSLSHIRDSNSPDDGVYVTAGWRVSMGDALYRDAVTNHPPLMNWLIGGVMRVAGPSLTVVRAAFLVSYLLSLVLLYLLVRRLHSERAAALAVLFFGLDPFMLVIAPRLTVMLAWVVMLWIPAIYFYVRGDQDAKLRWIFLGGIFGGLAIMMKQVGLFIVPMMAWYEICIGAGTPIGARIRRFAIFVLGVIAPVAVMLGILAGRHTLRDFWLYAYGMNELNPLHDMDYKVRWVASLHLGRLLLWCGLGLICSWGLFKPAAHAPEERIGFRTLGNRLFLTGAGWWALNTIFLFLPLRLQDHYLIPVYFCLALILPPIILRLSQGFALRRDGIWLTSGSDAARRVSVISLLASLALIVMSTHYLRSELDDLRAGRVPGYATEEEQAIGDYVKSITAPTDRIFCFANPIFYYRSERAPSTKYFGVFGAYTRSRIQQGFVKSIVGSLGDARTEAVVIEKDWLYREEFGKVLQQPFTAELEKQFRKDKSFEYGGEERVEVWIKKTNDDSTRDVNPNSKIQNGRHRLVLR